MRGCRFSHVIDVWFADRSGLTIATEAALAELSADERRRAAKLTSTTALRSFVVSRWMFRVVLGSYLGTRPRDVVLSANEYGKPEPRHRPPHANLSHTRNFTVVIASAQAAVGVDLECPRAIPDCRELSKLMMNNREQKIFSTLDTKSRERRFLELWVMKEAVLKCKGVGLSKSLRDVYVGWNRDLVEIERELYWVSRLNLGPSFISAIASAAPFRYSLRDFASLVQIVQRG